MRTTPAWTAARATLEGWRPAVQAALQPVLLVDDDLVLLAGSASAQRLLALPPVGRPVREAGELMDLDDAAWVQLPWVAAVLAGQPQRDDVVLAGDRRFDVLASPLFGIPGLIGATAFLTVR